MSDILDTCQVVFVVVEVDVVAATSSELISIILPTPKVIVAYPKHIIDNLKPTIFIKTGRNVHEMSMHK